MNTTMADTQAEIERLRAELEESKKQVGAVKKKVEEYKSQAENIEHQRELEAKNYEKQLEVDANKYKKQLEVELHKTRKTNLFELLDHSHKDLFMYLHVSTRIMSTKGNPANAEKKIRPEEIREWENFATEQEEIWNVLMDSDFAKERHYKSSANLRSYGEDVNEQAIGSEMDLNHFQTVAINNHVRAVIKYLCKNTEIREYFQLKGDIAYENHANTLEREPLEPEMQKLNLGDPTAVRGQESQGARSGKAGQAGDNADSSDEPLRGKTTAYPHADQFCAYNVGKGTTQQRRAAFVMEYKAPHKVTLGHIAEGLHPMTVGDFVSATRKDRPVIRFRRLMAAVITQAFSYMVRTGVEYGCVCTGEATIFLRVPEEDCRIVEYYISVPSKDIGTRDCWKGDFASENKLHLTAVGQMLAFTLRAMRTEPRSQAWRQEANNTLKVWNAVPEEMLLELRDDEVEPTSAYRPRDSKYMRMSPAKLRERHKGYAKTGGAQDMDRKSYKDPDTDSDGSDGFGVNPDTPCPTNRGTKQTQNASKPEQKGERTNKNSRKHGQTFAKAIDKPYCTQKCLLGLSNGGQLDRECPNFEDHGNSQHRISRQTFLRLLREQLFKNPDEGCAEFGKPGSRGVMFKVRLLSHGYTMVAKGTVWYFVPALRYEAMVYERLRSIQGEHVPICLGNINLKQVWFYQGFADVVHMMFLSFCGTQMWNAGVSASLLKRETEKTVRAVHGLKVLQRDIAGRNLLWQNGHVMMIDFERAKYEEPRKPLALISANNRQRRNSQNKLEALKTTLTRFNAELQEALREAERCSNRA